MMGRFIILGALVLTTIPSLLRAQEIAFLSGQTTAVDTNDSSYAWKIDYRQEFARYSAWSVSWINEGHVDGHRRDGPTALLWLVLPLFKQRASIALGAGAYRYFDTVAEPNGRGSIDNHGFAPVYSVSGTIYTPTPIFLRMTLDQIVAGGTLKRKPFKRGSAIDFGKRLPVKKAMRPASTLYLPVKPPPMNFL